MESGATAKSNVGNKILARQQMGKTSLPGKHLGKIMRLRRKEGAAGRQEWERGQHVKQTVGKMVNSREGSSAGGDNDHHFTAIIIVIFMMTMRQ